MENGRSLVPGLGEIKWIKYTSTPLVHKSWTTDLMIRSKKERGVKSPKGEGK